MCMKFMLRIFLFSFILCIVNGCISVDDLVADKKNEGTISCMVNGELFEVEGGKGLAASEHLLADMVKEDGSFLLTVFGVKVQEDKKGLAIGFKLGGEKVADVNPGDVFTEWEVLDEVEGTFEGAMGGVEERESVSTPDHLLKASSNHTGEMSLTIDAIDTVEQRISGTFSFTAKDKENGTIMEIKDGVFENVRWEEKTAP